VGAGQTGGWGYFLDAAPGDESYLEGYELPARINSDVNIQRVNPIGAAQLRGLVEEHLAATGSAKAKAILDDWEVLVLSLTLSRTCTRTLTLSLTLSLALALTLALTLALARPTCPASGTSTRAPRRTRLR
jgi:hypothetical protein